MPGITRERSEKIQEAAMQIVALHFVSWLDAIENKTARKAILRGWAYQLVTDYDITLQTARQHVARACRRQRHPEWQPPDNWGGKRDGSGRKYDA